MTEPILTRDQILDEREEFEAWLAREWPGLVIDRASLMGFYKGDDGPRIEDMWSGWRAARRFPCECRQDCPNYPCCPCESQSDCPNK